MRCDACDKVIADTSAYCAYCGAKAAAGGIHAPVFRFNLSDDKAVTLKDLAYALDRNWQASQVHLYSGDFANWLGSMGRGVLADQAREIVRSYPENTHLGLELFVRLISDAANADIPAAGPALDPAVVNFGAVPRDNFAETKLTITNAQERGYLSGRVRVPPGVTWLALSGHAFAGPRTEITLTATTRGLPAGGHYRTRLMLTTPFETVETEVVMRVATEWSALLRAVVSWTLAGGLGVLLAAVLGLLLREVGAELPWSAIYMALAALAAVVAFGSLRTRDTALAIVLSALIGLAMLLPLGLVVLVLSFVVALASYQTVALALTTGSTAAALGMVGGVGAALGGAMGLFMGLRRLRRTPAGCMLALMLLAVLVGGIVAFGPSVAFGAFTPPQPVLENLSVPVPYLAFAATVPPSGPTQTAVALQITPPTRTPTRTPTPARRSVEPVTMLWEADPVVDLLGEGNDEAALPPDFAPAADAALDQAGRLHVAYAAPAQGGTALYYLSMEKTPEAVAAGSAISSVVLLVDEEDVPYVIYMDQAEAGAPVLLHMAVREDGVWATTLVNEAARAPAFAIGAEGAPLVAYFGEGGALNLARYIESEITVEEEAAEAALLLGEWDVDTIGEEAGAEVDLDAAATAVAEAVAAGEGGAAGAGCVALAVDEEGAPHLAYVEPDSAVLRYARYVSAPEAAGTATPGASPETDAPTPTPSLTPVLTPTPEVRAGWRVEVVTERSRRAGCDVALALNPVTGMPHVLFYDIEAEHLYEAASLPGAGAWRVDRLGAARPADEGTLHRPLSLAVDRRGRMYMSFNGPASLRVGRELANNVIQSAVVDGPSPVQQVLVDGAFGLHVVYWARGGVWHAELVQAPLTPSPEGAKKPTPALPATPTPTVTPAPLCGDGVCHPEEVDNCLDDCRGEGWACGNGLCEDNAGEDAVICPADCVVIPGEAP